MTLKERANEINNILQSEYPEPKTELTHANERELVVAVMLSAQTTDKKVNQVTPALFKHYQSWDAYSHADLIELQQYIHAVNFHKGKADRLIKAATTIIDNFQGKVPQTLAELITIPGIARKSANVILQELWGIAEGIVVDTHVTRVSNRLGITTYIDAVKIERDLMVLFPKEAWRVISGALVMHGRYVCKARKPNCAECALSKICPSAFKV